MQQSVCGSSNQELTDWHNRTVRLLSERFGTKKKSRSKKKPLPPPSPPAAAVASLSAAAQQPREQRDKCGADRAAANCVEAGAEPPKVVDAGAALPAEKERTPPKPDAAATQRQPCVKDEESALSRIKLLLLETSEEETSSSVDSRRASAVRRYGDLYATWWPAARKALDAMAELDGMDNLKEKILLSVMVLCYKDCRARRGKMQDKMDEAATSMRKVGTEPTGEDDMDKAFLYFLRTNADEYSYEPTVQDVIDRLAYTLYEYPLCNCKELRRFADECARVAWDLCTVCRVISSCPWVNCDDNEFSETKHVRKGGSDANSDKIASCIWPCLLDGKAEICLYKGVVVTH